VSADAAQPGRELEPAETQTDDRASAGDRTATDGSDRASSRERSPAELIRSRLLKGSRSVFTGMALGAVLGLIVNALLARLLTHEALGAYYLMFSLAAFGAQIANLGMEKAVVRGVAAGLGTGRPGEARAATRLAFTFGSVGALVVAAVLVVGLGGFLARHVYHSELMAGAIVFGAGWLITLAMQTLVAETFRGYQKFWLATLFSGLSVDILGVVVFGLLWLGHAHPTLAQAIVITFGVTAVSVLIGGGLIVRRVRSLGREGHVSPRQMLSIGWPLVLTSAFNFTLGTGIDLWVIGAFRSADEVALYGAAFRLVFFVATPFIIASQVVPPIIAELYAKGRKQDLEVSLREVATIAGIPASMVLLAFLFFGASIMGFVYGDFFRQGATVLAVLSVARLYAVCTGNSGALLMMTGHQKTMMRITMTSAIFGLTAELIAVRPFGMVGVAVATALAQILQNTLQLVIGHRRTGIWSHAELSLRPIRAVLGR
jgi:O-antigen/teichoic acid export membrane protein